MSDTVAILGIWDHIILVIVIIEAPTVGVVRSVRDPDPGWQDL